MKFSTLTFMAVAALAAAAIAGCGDASSQVIVTCQQSVTIIPGSPLPSTGLVVQAVQYTDPGIGGNPAPLSLSNARIISPFPSAVQICAGSCASGAAGFGPDVKVQTDVSGILEYTVQVSQPVTSVDLIAVFGTQTPDSCKVTVGG